MVDPTVERIFRENYAIIRAKCVRMLANEEEASDVAQEAFTRLCERGVVHDEPAARAAWIYRTCNNLAIDRLRRHRRGVETREGGQDCPSGAAPVDAVVAARQALALVAASAPRRELEVAVLCRVDDLTHAEAAQVARLSERTVRRLLGRFDDRVARFARRDR